MLNQCVHTTGGVPNVNNETAALRQTPPSSPLTIQPAAAIFVSLPADPEGTSYM